MSVYNTDKEFMFEAAYIYIYRNSELGKFQVTVGKRFMCLSGNKNDKIRNEYKNETIRISIKLSIAKEEKNENGSNFL
jgi:hypothetical protein